MTVSGAWNERAEAWIAWARRPNHDGFWDGTWPELRSVLPPPPRLVVDVGCGEGRASRELLSFSAGFLLDAFREFGDKPIPRLMVMRLNKPGRGPG